MNKERTRKYFNVFDTKIIHNWCSTMLVGGDFLSNTLRNLSEGKCLGPQSVLYLFIVGSFYHGCSDIIKIRIAFISLKRTK